MISCHVGMQTAVALMKKASLEPLQEKDSSSLEPVKIVRKKMLRCVSFCSTFYNSDENLEDYVIFQLIFFLRL